MYVFNPSPAEKALLWLIRQHESGQNYAAVNPKPNSSAQGAYQFITSTWQFCSHMTGITAPTANRASPVEQDTNGLLLLRLFGPNSTRSWAASGPYPTFFEVKGMLAAVGVLAP